MPIGTGDGDAICIRYEMPGGNLATTVIDGGYAETGEKIVEHLSSVYRDLRIREVVLTHADDDHARGLATVLEECGVGILRMNRPWLYAEHVVHYFHRNWTVKGLVNDLRDRHSTLVELEEIANRRGTKVASVFQGERYGPFTVLAPSKTRYISLIPDMSRTPQVFGQRRTVGAFIERVSDVVATRTRESWGLETLQDLPPATGASNESSVVHLFQMPAFSALLTGDAGPDALNEAFDFATELGVNRSLQLFQIPHQGSRRNLTPTVLDKWLGSPIPQGGSTRGTAYCSVGTNKDGHPRKRVQNALHRRGYPVQVGRGANVCFAPSLRRGYSPLPYQPFWHNVEDE